MTPQDTYRAADTEQKQAEWAELDSLSEGTDPGPSEPETETDLLEEDLPASPGGPGKGKLDLLTEILDYAKTFLLVLVVALLLTQFVIQRNTVKGQSMVPTLQDGDELLVEKVTRYFGAINRFDIITVDTHWVETDHPNRVIKRVIGLPGETVEIKEGKVYINDQVLDQPFLAEDLKTLSRDSRFSKVTLGTQEYYVLGDNRNNSTDSRYYGPVPQSAILGKLLVRFYPFEALGVPK
ncbi:MAG: signal peptidase I [Eubacteriales bacterium]|nr:signal peptidase I [Eubacteriales bacterium]